MTKQIISHKAEKFTESVIREMTRQANKYGAINLSQGFPDFPAPLEIKKAAMAAIESDINQYAITWGAKKFRDAIAAKTKNYLDIDIDPDREVCVTCGSTEAMISAMMAIDRSTTSASCAALRNHGTRGSGWKYRPRSWQCI